MAGRSSQIVGETIAEGSPNARSSQVVGETLAEGSPNARASQIVGETAASGSPNARVSQLVGEIEASGSPDARFSQIALSILVRSFVVTQPPIYPDLPGLTFPVKWVPNPFVQSEKSGSGAEVDVSLAATMTHDFELTYTLLREGLQYDASGIEFKTMFGFFGRMNGPAGRFLYLNPHDNYVTDEPQGTGDGSTVIFGPLTRTFGLGENSFTEPVGYLDITRPIVVYLNEVPQLESTYSFITTTPGKMYIKFNSAPAVNAAIDMDFGYFYYCKFAKGLEFNEFMRDLFELQKVNIRSCRGGT